MQITVFGASGRVGRLVVELALDEGISVVAFVHSKNPFVDDKRLTVVKGDISDPEAVKNALKGSQAAISTLGSWGTKDKNVLSEGMRTIIPAMEAVKINRLITVTGSGAIWSGDNPSFIDKSSHLLLGLVAPKILRDGEDHLRQLDASGLDWTSIRSPVMSSKDSVRYRLSTKAPSLIAKIPRRAVAKCLVDQLESADFSRKAPHIHSA